MCPYEKANTFNACCLLDSIHDPRLVSHAREGRNADTMMSMGCTEQLKETIKCRPEDRIGEGLMDRTDPAPLTMENLKKAQRRTLNRVTAWWDASQIYGYDETSSNA